MNGCRPLTRIEVKRVLNLNASTRDNALVALGFCTGYRISEILSLKISDVSNEQGNIFNNVHVKHTKNGQGRGVALNSTARKSLGKRVKELLNLGYDMDTPLFGGRTNKGLVAITRQMGNRIIKKLFELAKVVGGKLASHTLRKTFAMKMKDIFNSDYHKIQQALGHKSIVSTMAYMSIDNDEIQGAIAACDY